MNAQEHTFWAEAAEHEAALAEENGDMAGASSWRAKAQEHRQIAAAGGDQPEPEEAIAPSSPAVPEPTVDVQFEAPTVSEPEVSEPDINVGGRLPSSGEVTHAPVKDHDAGYYYFETAYGRWVPTTRADAHARKQNGQQVIEPKER